MTIWEQTASHENSLRIPRGAGLPGVGICLTTAPEFGFDRNREKKEQPRSNEIVMDKTEGPWASLAS
jgi:hypothetical protein